MINKRMEEKIETGDALDLCRFPKTAEGDYLLTAALGGEAERGGTDFCDSEKEAWIWSIGVSLADGYVTMADGTQRMLPAGTYLASTSSKFYLAEEKGWRCVWLR
jgi:hypothetical protein